jgi:hypothetical protein
MNGKKLGWGSALAVVLVIVFGVFAFRPRTEANQKEAQGAAGAKYTIVETEGTNLLVVDNSTSTLFFYTVEPGKEVGDDLYLRGSLDLTQVGKPVLKPKKESK